MLMVILKYFFKSYFKDNHIFENIRALNKAPYPNFSFKLEFLKEKALLILINGIKNNKKKSLNSSPSMTTLTPAVIVRSGSDLLYSTYFQARSGECSNASLRSWTRCSILVSSWCPHFNMNTSNSFIAYVICNSKATLHGSVGVGFIPTSFYNHSTSAFCEGLATAQISCGHDGIII